MDLDKYSRDIENNNNWMEILQRVLLLSNKSYEVKVEGQMNMDKMDSDPFWKAKKKCLKIIKKYSIRFGIAEQEDGEEKKEFATYWADKFGMSSAESCIQFIKVYNTGIYVPKQVLIMCCNFLSQIVRTKVIKEKLKPHYEEILFSQIFPL